MYFHGVKSTAHPPIIGLLGHSTYSVVKQWCCLRRVLIKQGVPQKRRVLEKNFQHKSCSLITYWWEHLEQLQTRIEAIDEPHPMHIRSLCAGLTPLLTSAPMVNIIRWPVVVGHWLIRSVVWHGQHHQMLQLSDTNRDTQWWLVTAHPCWAFLSFTCCREMKSTFLFGVPQVTEVLQLT